MLKFQKIGNKKNSFFCSDLHFSHANICKATTTWTSGYRDFDSLEEMNATIIKNINDMVGENDIIFHEGDWSFGGKAQIWETRKQIVCKNIYTIIGNHDYHISENAVINLDTKEDLEHAARIGARVQLKANKSGYFTTAQELFTQVNDILYASVEGQPIMNSHYPFVSWFHSTKGVWNLSGHEHGQLADEHYYNKSMDVGIDVAAKLFGKYRPFAFEEIEYFVNKKDNPLAHH